MKIIDVANKQDIATFRDLAIAKFCSEFSFELYGLELQIDEIDLYLDSLIQHIRYVREAGGELGVHSEQLYIHDQSKFSDVEFPYYTNNFYGPKTTPNAWANAWLHHIHNNQHHWQYWIFSDGYTPRNSDVENGCVEMPFHYLVEMIADWMGASRAYTGSWDMTDWLAVNMSRISLHSNTVRQLNDLLNDDYYDVLVEHKWKHEIGTKGGDA